MSEKYKKTDNAWGVYKNDNKPGGGSAPARHRQRDDLRNAYKGMEHPSTYAQKNTQVQQQGASSSKGQGK